MIRSIVFKVIYATAASTIIAVGAVIWLWFSPFSHPSRESLKDTFSKYSANFERLRIMVDEDKLEFIGPSIYSLGKSGLQKVWQMKPEDFGLTPERFKEYIDNLQPADIAYGIDPFRENRETFAPIREQRQHERECRRKERRGGFPCLRDTQGTKDKLVLAVSFQSNPFFESWKGFAYTAPGKGSPCDEVVQDIDRSPRKYSNTYSACEPIRDGWWLYYRRWTY